MSGQSKALPFDIRWSVPFEAQLGALLQQAAGPGDNGQGDSAPELLQKPHQGRVGHPPGAVPVHLQQDVSTPTQKEMKVRSLSQDEEIKPIRGMIATVKSEHCDLVTFVKLQSPEDPEKKE